MDSENSRMIVAKERTSGPSGRGFLLNERCFYKSQSRREVHSDGLTDQRATTYNLDDCNLPLRRCSII